jgi:hypothetical protein
MSKTPLTNYIFKPVTRTLILPGLSVIQPERLALITNLTTKQQLFIFGISPPLEIRGNTIIFHADMDMADMSEADSLRIDYDDGQVESFARLSKFTDDITISHGKAFIGNLPVVSAVNQFVLPPTDLSGYATLTIEVSDTFNAQITAYEGITGNDMKTCAMINNSTEDLTTIISGPGLFTVRLRAPMFALKVTGYTSGSPVVRLWASTHPFTPRTVSTVSSSLTVFDTARTLSGVATFTSSASADVRSKRQLLFYLDVSGVGGTSPSLTATLQSSVDGAPPWHTIERADGTPVRKIMTQNGQYSLGCDEAFGRFVRLQYGTTGTLPTFTITTRSIAKD